MGKYLKDDFKLLDDQLPFVKGLVSRRRALLVSSTGSGKTPACLYGFAYLLSKSCVDKMVVLTPVNAFAKKIWEVDALRLTHLRVVSLESIISDLAHGGDLEVLLSRCDVIYGKHTHVKTDFEVLRSIYTSGARILTVLDEVHVFRTPKTQLSQAMSLLLRGTYALWGITATVLSKNCMDTYNLVNFIYPKFFKSARWFQNTFCVTSNKIIGRNPDGSFRKVFMVTDYKDVAALQKYCEPILVVGVPPLDINIHSVQYRLNDADEALYSKVAAGIMLSGEEDDASWISRILSREDIKQSSVRSVKDLERHSSRFVYLQAVTDGALNLDGTFGVRGSGKVDALVGLCRELAAKGQSALIYCDYYSSVDVVVHRLQRAGILGQNGQSAAVVEQSPRTISKKSSQVTEGAVLGRPHFIVFTRGTSESGNFPFINNVIFFSVPMTPLTFLQAAGRILRRNTKYPGDLHEWILHSEDISEYLLIRCGVKLYFQTELTFSVSSFPEAYIKPLSDAKQLEMAKRYLLWRKGGVQSAKAVSENLKKAPASRSLVSMSELFSGEGV